MTHPAKPPWLRPPLWFVIALALAFLALGALLLGRDWRRERDYLREMYLWRGEALINSMAVLGRIRPSEPGAQAGLENFWDSLADEEQILFLALTDEEGRLLASAGRLAPPPGLFRESAGDPAPADVFQPRLKPVEMAGRRVGLVYRFFRSFARRRMMMGGHHAAAPPPRIMAWVGLDLAAADRLAAGRRRSAALSLGLVCLTGLAVVLAIFGGHHARLARRLYREVRAELARKERLAALGGLAAGLAHEIRNPLGAIGGLCQHLLARNPAGGSEREALEVMLAGVERLNRAVTDFLSYAKPAEIEAAPLDLGALLRRTAALIAHDARSGAVELTLNLPEEPLWIAGDEPLLAQAFLNLYLNAIEAAREAPGGGRLAVTLARAGRQACLSFHDNGPGFSPEQLARPFTPYFTTKAKGTGLGLALTEKTVLAHAGGGVTLGPAPAGGAAVTLTFDLIAQPHNDSQGAAINHG